MGGSRSATSEEGVSLLWEAEACRGGLLDHHRHDHLQRGHFAPSVPRKGTCPEWTPASACLCLPLCGGSRGSTLQTRMLSQVETQLIQLRYPHSPEVFQT